MVNGDEYDALTRAKKLLNWHTGQRGRIKKQYRRRERRLAQQGQKGKIYE